MTNNKDSPVSGTAGHADPKDVGLVFLANFVHQVVNPLTGVIGTLDNITDGTYKGPEVTQKINACRAQIEQCVALIRNLAYLSDFFFEVSTKETPNQAQEKGTSVLPQVVIEAAQFFQIAAGKKGMHIEMVDSITQYKLTIRPELLRQIFINMFDNWLKYGLNNETVKVQTATNSKRELVIEIVGKSIGFDNKDAHKLFELGYRSPQARDKVAQGTGIGLYICSQIVTRALTGHVSAEHRSSSNESIFRIAIPKSKWHL